MRRAAEFSEPTEAEAAARLACDPERMRLPLAEVLMEREFTGSSPHW